MLFDEGLPSLDKQISGNIYQFVDSGSILICINMSQCVYNESFLINVWVKSW